MIRALFIVSAILMQASPSANSTPATAAAPASATVSPLTVTGQTPISKRRDVDPSAVVCHDEIPIGSRFPKKVCATNAAFAERAREDREMVNEWQNTPITTSKQ